MGGEIDVIQCYGSPSLALCIQLGIIKNVCLAYRGFGHAKLVYKYIAMTTNWQDAKMWLFEYYIVNCNNQHWPQSKVKMLEHIQPHLTILKALGS